MGAMTEMACDAPRSAQEARFSQALPTVTTWRQREDGSLELAGGAAIVAVPLQAPGAPGVVDPNQPVDPGALAGTSWVLVGIDDTVDLAGIEPTIAFAPDGSVAGPCWLQPVQRPVRRRWRGAHVRWPDDDPHGLRRSGGCGRAHLPRRPGQDQAYAIDGGGQLVLDGTAGSLIFRAVAG